ncbi:hypothetical protein PG993_001101 [Apiospora rasikravindrae]|uniref:Uncharacterized protein n=1 Tax=Apiospora rasikravindrae TaxID=990691 RepID=A0ABR1UAE5_9PEZI
MRPLSDSSLAQSTRPWQRVQAPVQFAHTVPSGPKRVEDKGKWKWGHSEATMPGSHPLLHSGQAKSRTIKSGGMRCTAAFGIKHQRQQHCESLHWPSIPLPPLENPPSHGRGAPEDVLLLKQYVRAWVQVPVEPGHDHNSPMLDGIAHQSQSIPLSLALLPNFDGPRFASRVQESLIGGK